MRASVQRDPAGRPVRLIGVDRDVTAYKTTLEALQRLTGELDHRTRNIIALVQAIATQTLSPGPEQKVFLERLSALLHAHSLAAKSGGGTDLAELIAAELEPYPSERASCSGPSLRLSARAAQALAMALHELATNAAKYGALAGDRGHLSLVWSVEGGNTSEPLLRIEWSEVAGRPVTPPEQRGFGGIVIEGSIAHELRGTVDRRFRPEGLQVTLTLPLSQVAATPPAPGDARG
jgi:two-component sensor histidine kinase